MTESIPVSKYKLLKHVMEETGDLTMTHFYCSSCGEYVAATTSTCSMCSKAFDKAHAVKNGHFFVYIPIREQIKEMLESGFVESHLVDPARSRDAVIDSVDGLMYRSSNPDRVPNLETLTLTWNYDGLPVYKSSGASLWPILVQINELKPDVRKEQVLLCGVWYGPRKPNWLTYSKPFLEELRSLGSTGIEWTHGNEEKVTKVSTLAIVCDSPARCVVQGAHQFNGAFGCTWCLQEGEVVPRGNGQARVYEYEVGVPKRTQASIIQSARHVVRDNLDHHHGVKMASPLLALPAACGVDLVRSFSVDYMHSVLLGVVRQVLDLWFGSKWSDQDFSLRGSLDEVDGRLLAIKPPHDLSRTPRTIKESGRWKASECRNWLLYFSVPCLYGVMRTKYLNHWTLLVSAIDALLQDSVAVEDIDRAERALRSFSREFESLYGLEHMTSNIHSTLHLADSVRNLGPLWCCSAFPFEGYMMTVKKFFNGTTRLPQQVATAYLMSQGVERHLRDVNCADRVRDLAHSWLKRCSPGERIVRSVDGAVGLNATRTLLVTSAERRLLGASGHDVSEGSTGLYVRRAIIGGSICCTKQHGEDQRRDSFTLFTRYGVGRVDSICFLGGHGDMRCFLFLRKCALLSPLLRLKSAWVVRETDSLMLCTPADVRGNAVVVQASWEGGGAFVCTKQPNRVEKD